MDRHRFAIQQSFSVTPLSRFEKPSASEQPVQVDLSALRRIFME
jgi:hypothetical protein